MRYHGVTKVTGIAHMVNKLSHASSLLGVSIVLVVSVGLGCGHESAATQQVRSAAAVDLECDPSVIELSEDGPMVRRASGCGRTLTYMYQCNASGGGGQDCRWKPVRDDENKL